MDKYSFTQFTTVHYLSNFQSNGVQQLLYFLQKNCFLLHFFMTVVIIITIITIIVVSVCLFHL